jgi:hypothetical protein
MLIGGVLRALSCLRSPSEGSSMACLHCRLGDELQPPGCLAPASEVHDSSLMSLCVTGGLLGGLSGNLFGWFGFLLVSFGLSVYFLPRSR